MARPLWMIFLLLKYWIIDHFSNKTKQGREGREGGRGEIWREEWYWKIVCPTEWHDDLQSPSGYRVSECLHQSLQEGSTPQTAQCSSMALLTNSSYYLPSSPPGNKCPVPCSQSLAWNFDQWSVPLLILISFSNIVWDMVCFPQVSPGKYF